MEGGEWTGVCGGDCTGIAGGECGEAERNGVMG